MKHLIIIIVIIIIFYFITRRRNLEKLISLFGPPSSLADHMAIWNIVDRPETYHIHHLMYKWYGEERIHARRYDDPATAVREDYTLFTAASVEDLLNQIRSVYESG